MSDCLFCKIAAHAIPAYVIYEDDVALAFLDIHPKAPGHTVVIPKVHVAALAGLDGGRVGPLFLAVQRVARMARERLLAEGLTIGINEGRASGQTVEHLHVHVLPRFEKDGGGSIHSVVENPPKESLEAMQKKLRQ
ncbi:MAG: HIT family protein [Candidatus Liptonbacteria bacterium]|nr:HIT family protein [Candidatus Liptonbacteria bacterium]